MFWTKNKEKKKAGTTIIGLCYDGEAAIGTDFNAKNPDGDEVSVVRCCNDILIGFTGKDTAAIIADWLESETKTCADLENACQNISANWIQNSELKEAAGKLIAISRDTSFVVTPGKTERVKTGIIAIGPGEEYALAAIRALLAQPEVKETVPEIVGKAFKVAAGVCVLVNQSAQIISLE